MSNNNAGDPVSTEAFAAYHKINNTACPICEKAPELTMIRAGKAYKVGTPASRVPVMTCSGCGLMGHVKAKESVIQPYV